MFALQSELHQMQVQQTESWDKIGTTDWFNSNTRYVYLDVMYLESQCQAKGPLHC